MIEVLVALAIFSIIALIVSTLFLGGLESLSAGDQLSRATAVTQEGLDAVRSIRDNKWTDLVNGDHGLDASGGIWVLSGTSDTVDEFTRVVTISDVERDGSGNIVATGGTVDGRTKLITVTVSWSARGGVQSTSASTYLTDWNVFDWHETNDSEFDAGNFFDTARLDTGDDAYLALLEGSSDPFQQDSGAEKLVSLEAENYHRNTSGVTDDWILRTDVANYSGDGFMRAEVDDGDDYATGYSTSSPHLEFDVNFVATGTHYIWVRGYTTSNQSDRVHVGLDGSEVSTGEDIDIALNAWEWTNDDGTNTTRTLNIASTGEHTIDVWMDEDGFAIDKIVLTTDATYIPTGTGPTESSQGGGSTPMQIVDDTQVEFDAGSYSSTVWNTDHVELTGGATSGTYSSQVYDAGETTTSWDELSWIEDLTGSEILKMEVGSATADGNFSTVNLQNTYTSPVVVPFYYESANTAVVSPRLDNITATSFDVALTSPAAAPPTPGSIVDDTQAEFDAGVYSDTQWNTDHVELDTTGISNGTGAYTSTIFDSGAAGTSWSQISWVESVPGDSVVTTTNPNFDTDTTNWTYTDWAESGGEDATGTLNPTGGNPNGWIDINVGAGKGYTVGGFWEQSFTTSVANPATATLDFDWQVTAVDTSNTFQLYAFVDSASGEPTIGQEVWSSGEISATQGWTSQTDIDVSGALGAAGTYYLKVAMWVETPSGPGAPPGPYEVGYDNVELEWLEPSGADIEFQVRSCDDAACSGETFVGPDGTTGTEYNTPAGEVLNVSNNQYFQYRATLLNTDSASTPELSSVTIDYTEPGATLASDTVHYIVMEEGAFTMPDGTLIEAELLNTTTVGYKGSWNAVSQSFANTYSSAPVVLHAVQTYNDSGWIESWVSADGSRTGLPSTTAFQIGMNGAEAVTSHAQETLGWIAIETGSGTIDGVAFEAAYTADFVRGKTNGDGCFEHDYSGTYSSAPITIADQEKMDGNDGSWGIGCSNSTTQIGLRAQEDQETDSEVGHTTETFAYVAFAAAFDYEGDGKDITFQVRSCDDAACSGESFVGPDGTSGTVFTTPSGEVIDVADNQYFQYQVSFSADDAGNSPELSSVTVDYTVTSSGGGGGGVYPNSGTFESQIFNSDSTATLWGTLFWDEDIPTNTNITVAVRSGNTATPDGTWSAWSSEFTNPDGNDLSAQNGQYLQYRVSFSTSDTAVTSSLFDITVTYK